jgi:hypothetical protein
MRTGLGPGGKAGYAEVVLNTGGMCTSYPNLRGVLVREAERSCTGGAHGECYVAVTRVAMIPNTRLDSPRVSSFSLDHTHIERVVIVLCYGLSCEVSPL